MPQFVNKDDAKLAKRVTTPWVNDKHVYKINTEHGCWGR